MDIGRRFQRGVLSRLCCFPPCQGLRYQSKQAAREVETDQLISWCISLVHRHELLHSFLFCLFRFGLGRVVESVNVCMSCVAVSCTRGPEKNINDTELAVFPGFRPRPAQPLPQLRKR
jgi:hypothetical protein